MAAVGFFDVVSGVPTFTQVELINITLVFEKYEQTVKICILKTTKVRDLPKILGVKNWMAIDVKESPFFMEEVFSLLPHQNLCHNGVYFAEWITKLVDDEIMYEVIVVE